MRLFHGSSEEIKAVDVNRCMYFSSNIDDAKSFAMRLDDCGNYAEESFIYAIDIDETIAVIIEDFDEFDNIAYNHDDKCPEIAYNPEYGWYCIKHPIALTLIEHYKNEL